MFFIADELLVKSSGPFGTQFTLCNNFRSNSNLLNCSILSAMSDSLVCAHFVFWKQLRCSHFLLKVCFL